MRYDDVFPSRWLAANDLQDSDLTVTIRDEEPVEHYEFKQQGKATPESKPVLFFKSPRNTKPLILNKTNWRTIAQVLGSDDSDTWAGKQITLYPTEVESFGEMTQGFACACANRLKRLRQAARYVLRSLLKTMMRRFFKLELAA